jgi:uncharacterized protein (DUF1697 family)
METYISMLRGINVSGQKMIKMKDLKELFESLKFKDVTTYIQSGNVVFNFTKTDPLVLAQKIEKKIADKYKFDVKVLITTAEEMQGAIDKNPFMKEKDADFNKLYFTFLSEIPKTENLNKLNEFAPSPDRFSVIDQVAYICCPNGYGNSKLNNNFFENKLKVSATTRNLNTVKELIRLAEQQ